ncbi:RNA polymerase sigma factor [Candidatus Parcubacteria bacterium]|nr:RNA polymerase sigma factor [Candidatus Parcubacteria bacterium]
MATVLRYQTARQEHLTGLTSEELCDLLADGHEPALGVLMNRHLDRLRKFIVCRVNGDGMAADDIVQITFIKIYERAGTRKRNNSFRAWMMTIAVHLAIDHIKGIRYKGRRSLEWVQTLGYQNPYSAHPFQDPHTDLEKEMESKDELDHVYKDLGDLPPEMRRALRLRFQGGMKYKEISDVTGKTVGALKMDIHRGRDYLKVRRQNRDHQT